MLSPDTLIFCFAERPSWYRGGREEDIVVKVTAATALVRILKAEGVPWVACYPTNHVNNALGAEGVPILMMREERYAVAVADAFSRVTGGKKIGVCTVMGGKNAAGLQLAYGAVAQAYEDSSPLLVITAGVELGASGHTHYDMAHGFQSVSKWVGTIDKAERVPDFMRRAFTYLRSGRPGPALLIVPPNLGEYDEAEHPYTPVKGWKSAPAPDDVKAAVQVLLRARDPLLYVGEGILYGDALDELRQFAELAQVPVLTTLKGKSAFPENHPLSVGVRGSLAEHFLRKCDLLFSLGSSLFPNRFSHVIPDAELKTIVQCTVDLLDINRSYETKCAVIGDAKLTLRALSDELSAQTGGGVRKKQGLLDEIKAGKEVFMAKYRPLMESNEKPLNPYRVFGDLMKVLNPQNSFLSHQQRRLCRLWPWLLRIGNTKPLLLAPPLPPRAAGSPPPATAAGAPPGVMRLSTVWTGRAGGGRVAPQGFPRGVGLGSTGWKTPEGALLEQRRAVSRLRHRRHGASGTRAGGVRQHDHDAAHRQCDCLWYQPRGPGAAPGRRVLRDRAGKDGRMRVHVRDPLKRQWQRSVYLGPGSTNPEAARHAP
jgi:acetolactate synthase-1/2/3 large subunit